MNSRGLIISLFVMLFTNGASKTSFTGQNESTMSMGGDFRYRHEFIDVENKDMRNRQRIRARINLAARLDDTMSLGFQLASGTDNPISTNQTLTGGFSTKPIMLDLAFFDWKSDKINGFNVLGGKMKNPFHSPGETELLWDSDLRPEGIAFRYSVKHDAVAMFVNTSYFWIDERKEQNDAVLIGSQAYMEYTGSLTDFLFGLGYFDYQNARGNPLFYNANDSYGNSVDSNNGYLHDFNEIEFFSEIAFPGLITDASVFLNYVTNIAKDVDDNCGWLAGFVFGKCRKPGSFAFRYSYRYLEKDALIGAFTDSDFIEGGTGGKGHEVNLDFQITPRTIGEVSYFFNKKGIDNGKGFHLLQLDMNFKF